MEHGTSGLVAMTSASHAEGRQFDPGLVYVFVFEAPVCGNVEQGSDLQHGELQSWHAAALS